MRVLNEMVLPWRRWVALAYHGPMANHEASGGLMTNGLMKALPFPVPYTGVFDRIGVNVFGAGSAGSVVRLGVYADNGVIGPDTLVADCGTVDSATTGRKEIDLTVALGATLKLGRGLYWLASVGQGAPATVPNVTRTTVTSLVDIFAPYTYQGHASNFTLIGSSWVRSGITGALPATLTPVRADLEVGGDMPYVWVRHI